MPVARFQMPDGRIARFEVPDGTTPEQAQAMVEKEFPNIAGASAANEPSMASRIGRQVGLTARAGLTGITAIPAMVGDVLGMDSTGAVQRLADLIGLPKPASATERVAGDVAGAMAGQGGVMAIGQGLTKAVGPVAQRVGNLLTTGRGVQTTAAAAGPAAGGVVREQGGSPGAQFAANIGATLAVPTIASMVKSKPVPAPISRVMREAEKRGVDLSYADITGGGGARRLDTMLEQAPVVGTSRFREEGAKKVTRAIENYADELGASLQKQSFRGMERIEAAAKAGDKSAQATLRQIQNAGEDWTKIMQASGNTKLWRSRQAAEQLYDRVEALAKNRGEVPLQRTNAALDAAINAESKSVIPDKDLLGSLNQIKTGLYDKQQGPRDFAAIRQLRSDLGDIVNNYYQGKNAAVGAKGVDKLQSLKNAVEGDMEAFATTSGDDLMRAWKRADSFYKNAVVPFKDKALAQALKSDLPDEIYKKFIQVSRSGAGEDRAQKFYEALDPKGRAAVRYGMVATAMDNAAVPEKNFLISPGKFEQSMQNIRNSTKVFFRGDEAKELDGFTNLMEHARRFGQYSENPPTGQRVIPWLALGGAAIRPLEMAGVGAAAAATTQLFTKPWGKELLLKASLLKAGSPEMEKVLQEISRQMPRIASQTQSPPNTGPQEQRRPLRSTPAAGAIQ